MRKNKRLFLGLMLFVVSMLTACGNVPELTQKDVVKTLEREGYVTASGVESNEYSVQMNGVTLSDNKKEATVECVVSQETEVVRINTEYTIELQIEDDKQSWKGERVSAGERTYELIKPISDAELEDLLKKKNIDTQEGYIYFNDSRTTYTVLNHEVRSSEMADVVTLKVNGTTDYNNVTVTVKFTLCYNAEEKTWKIQEREMVDIETSFVDGYEVTLSEERVLEDVLNKRKCVYVMGKYHYLDDDNTTISNVRVGENVYSGYYMTVPVSATVTCKDISFDVHFALKYGFDSDGKWVIKMVDIVKCEAFNNDIVGVWTGMLDNDRVVLTINNFSHSSEISGLDVIVEITLSTGEKYSYSAYVYEYNQSSGHLWIRPCDVIGIAPEGSYITTFDGYAVDGVYTPYTQWDNFLLTKAK